MTENGNYFRRVRPHAEWDATKIVLEAIKPPIYALSLFAYEKINHLDRDWVGIFVILAVGVLLAIIGYFLNWKMTPPPPIDATVPPKAPSKLAIISANYRAVEGGGHVFDVLDFLKRKTIGDSVVMEVKNSNFVIDGENFVPEDPKDGIRKRLYVTYSYGSGADQLLEGDEDDLFVLPANSVLQSLTPLQQRLLKLSADISKFLRELGPAPDPTYTKEKMNSLSSAEVKRLVETQDGDYAEASAFYADDDRLFIHPEQNVYSNIFRNCKRLYPWYERLRAEFAHQFRLTLEYQHRELLRAGIADVTLLTQVEGCKGVERARSIASRLWQSAFEAAK
jgi:hypothetical protein